MWHSGLAAWARATYQYHVNGTDTVGRSVGRSVDARTPVDHDSVGLAQARPKKIASYIRYDVAKSQLVIKLCTKN